jgi:hypothetical protein
VFGVKLTGDNIDLIRVKKKIRVKKVKKTTGGGSPIQAYNYKRKNFVPNIFSLGSLLGINYEITENLGINFPCQMNITKVYGKRDVIPNQILKD